MSRLMSVALTEDAVVDRRKTVTRRMGWQFLKPGDTLTLCRKVMGRKKGEPLVRLAEVEVVSVRRELLGDVTPSDVEKEGFEGMGTWEFVDFFLDHIRGADDDIDTEVTRIEWRYLPVGEDQP